MQWAYCGDLVISQSDKVLVDYLIPRLVDMDTKPASNFHSQNILHKARLFVVFLFLHSFLLKTIGLAHHGCRFSDWVHLASFENSIHGFPELGFEPKY